MMKLFASVCLLCVVYPLSLREEVPSKTYTYLALGDSYTIGESVKAPESFPYQLQQKLNKEGYALAEPEIIARTGWTSGELQTAIRNRKVNRTFDVVTLLIGVNNQYRGYSTETYRKEFRALLQTAVSLAGNKKEHVFVVSIPDWGVTPYARQNGFALQTVAREIDTFNAINREETQALGISYTDITPGSRKAAADATLLAPDGLHPSGKMYAEWVTALYPAVKAVL